MVQPLESRRLVRNSAHPEETPRSAPCIKWLEEPGRHFQPSTILTSGSRENYGKKRAGVEGGNSDAHASDTAATPPSLSYSRAARHDFAPRPRKARKEKPVALLRHTERVYHFVS